MNWKMQIRIYKRKVKRWWQKAVNREEWELWGIPQSSGKASSVTAQAKPPKWTVRWEASPEHTCSSWTDRTNKNPQTWWRMSLQWYNRKSQPKTPLRHLKLQRLLYTSEAICYWRSEIGHLENLGIFGWIILETDLKT